MRSHLRCGLVDRLVVLGRVSHHDSTPFCRPVDPPRLERGSVDELWILSLVLLSLAALGILSRKTISFCADPGRPCDAL